MGDVVIFLIEKYSGTALVALIVIYLLLEFGLDIVKDLVVDKIKQNRIDAGENEWGGKRE